MARLALERYARIGKGGAELTNRREGRGSVATAGCYYRKVQGVRRGQLGGVSRESDSAWQD